MEQQFRLQLFLRIMKKAPSSVMSMYTTEGETYAFQYVKEDKLWKVDHWCDNPVYYCTDMKRSVNKLLNRIGNVKEINIK